MEKITIKERQKNNYQPQQRVKNIEEEIKFCIEQGKLKAIDFFKGVDEKYYQNSAVTIELIKWYLFEMPLNTSPLNGGIKEMPLLDGVNGVANTPIKYDGLNEAEAYHVAFCLGLNNEIVRHQRIYKYSLN